MSEKITVNEDELDRMVAEAVDERIGEVGTTSNEDDTPLYITGIAANSPLDEATLSGEPDSLLKELALELVPDFTANSDPEELAVYDGINDLDVGTGRIEDVEERNSDSEGTTANTANTATDSDSWNGDIDDLDLSTGRIEDIEGR
jgi:hypothetical protein